jgi:hypothetical protein
MGQNEKSAYYQALKAAGAEFGKPYNQYTVAELKEAFAQLPPEAQSALQLEAPKTTGPSIKLPVAPKDPTEMAGVRQNTKAHDEPIRVDPETGFIWFQEEVLKKGYAAPRGRRVLKYTDPGVVKESAKMGEYVEEFEVAGSQRRAAEARITLPSYQVGIYKDPRHPFKTYTYNGVSGFSLFEVEEFYQGADRVPKDVKRIYVGNALCYDIRSVVRNIEEEYRRLQLAGRPEIEGAR